MREEKTQKKNDVGYVAIAGEVSNIFISLKIKAFSFQLRAELQLNQLYTYLIY